ncbi:MAG: hypothetical protein ACRDYE_14890, partial [Acidimicrobiales bacterium]
MGGKWIRRITLGAAAMAVASLAGVAPAAWAQTSVTSFSVTMNHFTPATTSTYTLGFRTSATGALVGGTGTITIDDGAGALPTSAADYSIGATGHSGQPSNVSTSGTSVTLTVPVVSGLNIGNSTIVSVTINPVTTPAAANYTMAVSTS